MDGLVKHGHYSAATNTPLNTHQAEPNSETGSSSAVSELASSSSFSTPRTPKFQSFFIEPAESLSQPLLPGLSVTMEPSQNSPINEIPKPHSPIAIKRRDLNTHWRLQRGSPVSSPMSMDFAPTPPRDQSATDVNNNSEESSPEWEQSGHTAIVATRPHPRKELVSHTHGPLTQNTRDFFGRQMVQQYEEAERAQQAHHNARGPQYPHQFYAYAYDRGNGCYTRLIPADMLPPLVGVPAYETDISRLFVVELPQALDANERNTNVKPVQAQVAQKDAVQVCKILQSLYRITTISSDPYETLPNTIPSKS